MVRGFIQAEAVARVRMPQLTPGRSIPSRQATRATHLSLNPLPRTLARTELTAHLLTYWIIQDPSVSSVDLKGNKLRTLKGEELQGVSCY